MAAARRACILAGVVAALALLPGGAAGEPRLAGTGHCPVFPQSTPWNRPVDKLPLDRRSDAIVDAIGRDAHAHADFGSGLYNGAPIGIGYVTVTPKTKRVPVSFEYADESDKGPYPVPPDVPVEGGRSSDGDRHVILV